MPTQRETLLALRERVLKAEGADRRLDAEIVVAATGGRTANTLPGCYWTSSNSHQAAPLVTSSIDEALVLVERALPEANCYGVERDPVNGFTAFVSRNCVRSGHWVKEAEHKFSGPLAICAALLTALASPETTDV